ncbi:MAG: TRAP transporter small permease [Oscillospiraceae bacterium]|jgi:TRAP-type C4-dicarboxylate transport system permease small subunit|nr:TRAP transporter small permease [Oscillospiraceae bacterium]
MLETFKKIGNVVGKFSKAICLISFLGVIAILLLNVADVVLAKTYKPILGAYEITQRLLLCTVFASFAYAQTKKTHINMTILIVRYPRAVRFAFFTIMSVLSVFAAGVLAYAAFYQGGTSLDAGTATEVLLIPLYPFFYVEALAMAAFAVVLLYDTVMSFISIFKDDFARHVMSEWT